MIRKVTNPSDYLELLEVLDREWKFENQTIAHVLPISKSGLSQLANAQVLTWEYHVWATKDNKSVLIFHGGFSPLFGIKVFQEVLWISKDKRSGLKMLEIAKSFARNSGFETFIMGRAFKTPRSERLIKIYDKMNLKKDAEVWIGKL